MATTNRLQGELERERLAIERERLRLDRQKAAADYRLRKREVEESQRQSWWKRLVANPLTVAILTGAVTIMVNSITTFLTSRENRQAARDAQNLEALKARQSLRVEVYRAKLADDSAKAARVLEREKARQTLAAERYRADLASVDSRRSLDLERVKSAQLLEAEKFRARLASEGASEALQAELIKKFVEGVNTELVQQNLRFLVGAGLLPNYAEGISAYMRDNPGAAPQIGSTGMVSGIVGLDDRMSFKGQSEETKREFSGVFRLDISTQDRGDFLCTAFFISPRILVTALHCIQGEQVGDAMPRLALSSLSYPGSAVPIELNTKKMVKLTATDERLSAYGVVVAEVKGSVPANFRYLPLASGPPAASAKFRLVAFAGDRGEAMITPDCELTLITSDSLGHLCDSTGGGGGAPLVDSSGRVIGVQMGGGTGSKVSWRGDRIRADSRVQAAFGKLPER